MSKVLCLFICACVADYGGSKTVTLYADTNSDASKDFTPYTPNGEINISIAKDAPAAETFKPGARYYVSFEAVDTAQLPDVTEDEAPYNGSEKTPVVEDTQGKSPFVGGGRFA